MKNHIYIEEKRLVEESHCKFYKRLLTGFLLYLKDNNIDNIEIDEFYFNNIPDNLGFETYTTLEPKRVFKIKNTWEKNKDDCGGKEYDSDRVGYSAEDGNITFELLPLLRVVKDGK